jgi:RND family efflux transporter MFP subunit
MRRVSALWSIAGLIPAIVAVAYVFLLPQSPQASPAGQPAAPAQTVRTVQPIRTDMARSFITNGSLEAYETTDLYPKVSGYLAEVRVDIGDHVKAGQVLAVISLPETEKQLAQAQAAIASKRANLMLQQITLQRQEGLLKIQGTSQQTYDEAKANASVAAADLDLAIANADEIRTTLAYTRISAPFDGVVPHRDVNRGDFAQSATTGRTTPLFTVQRVDIIRVFCNVPETDISSLRVGLTAKITPYGWEKPITGKVSRFEGRLDPQTRNMRTEIDVPNPGGRLYPGMYAQVALDTELHHNALILPNTAVGTDPNGKFVYAVQHDRIVRMPVQIGIVQDGVQEIVAGVSENTEVVASVQTAPAPGTNVRSAPRA